MNEFMKPDQTKIEIVGPNPQILELAQKIIEQNEIILKANAQLLTCLLVTPILFTPEVEDK